MPVTEGITGCSLQAGTSVADRCLYVFVKPDSCKCDSCKPVVSTAQAGLDRSSNTSSPVYSQSLRKYVILVIPNVY